MVKPESLALLNEYIPLILPNIEIEGNGLYLSCGHFQWCLYADIMEETDNHAQTFADGLSLELIGFSGLTDQALPNLNGKPFRLPDVSYVFGERSLVLSDKAISGIELSRKLGVTQGTTTLVDPFGGIHGGFHYISFHNPLELSRAVVRFQKLPPEQRPFLFVKKGAYEVQLLIRTEICRHWREAGIDCFLDDLREDYLILDKFKRTSGYFSNHELGFEGIDNWQANKFKRYTD